MRTLFLLICLPFLLGLGCEGSDTQEPNQPPDTELANVPLPNSRDNPYVAVLKLSWNGSDMDGYISGYEYSWTTHHLILGDSLVYPWRFTTRAESTFAFESSDSVNLQVFSVRARDDDGAVDPSPATMSFYTSQVQPPETWIIQPDSGSVHFVLPSVTDTWRGITFMFQGEDTDGEVVDYSWQLDQRQWSEWSDIEAFTMLRDDVPEPVAGSHTFRVKARDNTLVEDPTPAEINFVLVDPTFQNGILIVDETTGGAGGPESPTDQDVEAFYEAVLSGRSYDLWDVDLNGPPPLDVLGDYRLVLWHTDDANPEICGDPLSSVSSYLDIGGKLVLGGWEILRDLAGGSLTTTFEEGEFPRDYLHIQEYTHESRPLWRGGIGTGEWEGYVVNPDTVKLNTIRRGNLMKCDIVEPSTVFADAVLTFDHAREDTVYQGRPCAMFYDGTTYDVAFFGVPLFYTQEDQLSPLVDALLRRMGE